MAETESSQAGGAVAVGEDDFKALLKKKFAPRTDDAEILPVVLSALDEMKAEDVVTVDLRGKSAMADHLVIASGRSNRQVSAISEKTIEKLKRDAGRPARVEGKEAGDWVLIDAGDVIVHIFRPEVREFYQLEKMWLSPDEVLARKTH